VEKEIEEALVPKEGEHADPEARVDEAARLRFKVWCQLFYSASKQAEDAKRKEKQKLKEEEAKKNPPKEEDKTPQKPVKKETVTSPKSVAGDDEKAGPDLKNYNPIEPEQWQEKVLRFTKFHVIKMPRIF